MPATRNPLSTDLVERYGAVDDRRELLQRAQGREEDLVQTGEARPSLELHPGCRRMHAQRPRRLRRGVPQGGLADAGLAGHEQVLASSMIDAARGSRLAARGGKNDSGSECSM